VPGRLAVERRIVSPRLFPQFLKLLLALAEVLIDGLPIRCIESQSTEDLLKTQGRRGFGDSLRGLSPQKCVDYRVQRNTTVLDEVAAIPPLDVFPCYRATSSRYMQTIEACCWFGTRKGNAPIADVAQPRLSKQARRLNPTPPLLSIGEREYVKGVAV
jgi:hypothetical protein